MSDREFSDEEVQRILQRAADRQRTSETRGLGAGGFLGVPRRIFRPLAFALLVLPALQACGPADPDPQQGEDRPRLMRTDSVAPSSSASPLARRVLERATAPPDTTFGRLVTELSEPGGFFDTDNLISNEASYLHVLGALRRRGVTGGAYIGVGPDQNFAYIAAIRPEVAFVVDLRRDNVLQHLMFKTLFQLAETRVEYLSLLHGRALPENPREWWAATPEELVEYVREARGGLGTAEGQFALELIQTRVGEQGVALSASDIQTIRRFHEEFIRSGMSLRFSSFGSAPRPFYPTYEELLTETDLQGRPGSYVATRDGYVFLREMQAAGRIIPVVADLAGATAIRGIGDEIRSRGLTVSAFYTSNVEFYLWSSLSLGSYFGNLRRLPSDESSVVIRSYFPTQGQAHPDEVPGYVSTQTMQPLSVLQEDDIQTRLRSYYDLVTFAAIDPGGSDD